MMTINAVPTSTPIPIVEITRNRDEDKLIDIGTTPAANDLLEELVFAFQGLTRYTYATNIKTLSTSRSTNPSNMVTITN